MQIMAKTKAINISWKKNEMNEEDGLNNECSWATVRMSNLPSDLFPSLKIPIIIIIIITRITIVLVLRLAWLEVLSTFSSSWSKFLPPPRIIHGGTGPTGSGHEGTPRACSKLITPNPRICFGSPLCEDTIPYVCLFACLRHVRPVCSPFNSFISSV